MCNFFSALVTKPGIVLWHPMLDSHSDLVKHFGLRDDSASTLVAQRFAKVELQPQQADWLDPATWKFVLDEQTKPDWWNGVCEKAEKSMRAIAQEMIICSGERNLVVDGCWIIGGDAKVTDVRSGRIVRAQDLASISDVWGSASISNVRGSASISNVRGSASISNVGDSASISNVRGSASISNVGDSASISDVGGSASISDVGGSASISNVRGSASISNVGDSASISDVGNSASISNVGGSASISDVGGSASISDVWGSASISNVWDSASISDVWGSASISNVRDSVLLDESAKKRVVSEAR